MSSRTDSTHSSASSKPWKYRWFGAAIGVSIGLCVTAMLFLRHELVSAVSEEMRQHHAASFSSGRPNAEGIRTLGVSEMTSPEPPVTGLSPKAEALIFVVDARMQTGGVEQALADVLAIEPGPERDAGLKEMADDLVPPEAQINLNRLAEPTEKSRAPVLRKLKKLVELSDLADSGLVKSRLLLRAAMVKRLLDEDRPANGEPDEVVLDSEALVERAEGIARTMRQGQPIRASSFQWISGLLFSGALGLMGFIGAELAQPAIHALGALLASAAAHRSGVKALAERLEKEKAL